MPRFRFDATDPVTGETFRLRDERSGIDDLCRRCDHFGLVVSRITTLKRVDRTYSNGYYWAGSPENVGFEVAMRFIEEFGPPSDRHFLLQCLVLDLYRDGNKINRHKPMRLTHLGPDEAWHHAKRLSWQWHIECDSIIPGVILELGSFPVGFPVAHRLHSAIKKDGFRDRADEIGDRMVDCFRAAGVDVSHWG